MSTATGCSAATGATVTLSGAAARSAEQKRSREAAEAAEAANGCAASRPIVTEAAHAVPSKPRSRAKLNAGSRSASEAGTKMEVGSPSRPVGLAEINVRRPLKPSAAPSGHAAPASSRRSAASAMRAAGGSRRRSGAKIEAAAEETLTAASLLPAEAEAECRMGLLWQLLTGPQSKERVGAATRFLPDDSTSSGACSRVGPRSPGDAETAHFAVHGVTGANTKHRASANMAHDFGPPAAAPLEPVGHGVSCCVASCVGPVFFLSSCTPLPSLTQEPAMPREPFILRIVWSFVCAMRERAYTTARARLGCFVRRRARKGASQGRFARTRGVHLPSSAAQRQRADALGGCRRFR
eukprot:2191690-Pleurochrysis_carterae.AAC.1